VYQTITNEERKRLLWMRRFGKVMRECSERQGKEKINGGDGRCNQSSPRACCAAVLLRPAAHLLLLIRRVGCCYCSSNLGPISSMDPSKRRPGALTTS
jgi:hypothetical protein